VAQSLAHIFEWSEAVSRLSFYDEAGVVSGPWCELLRFSMWAARRARDAPRVLAPARGRSKKQKKIGEKSHEFGYMIRPERPCSRAVMAVN
jgi:hypothetical protein